MKTTIPLIGFILCVVGYISKIQAVLKTKLIESTECATRHFYSQKLTEVDVHFAQDFSIVLKTHRKNFQDY